MDPVHAQREQALTGSTCHMITVASLEPVANLVPSLENLQNHTSLQCSVRTCWVTQGNCLLGGRQSARYLSCTYHRHASKRRGTEEPGGRAGRGTEGHTGCTCDPRAGTQSPGCCPAECCGRDSDPAAAPQLGAGECAACGGAASPRAAGTLWGGGMAVI